MKVFETPREEVLHYYPNAKAINVGCKKGNYYHIIDGSRYLGKGKSSKNAWKAAQNNLNQ